MYVAMYVCSHYRHSLLKEVDKTGFEWSLINFYNPTVKVSSTYCFKRYVRTFVT